MAGYLFAIHSSKPVAAVAIAIGLVGLVLDQARFRVSAPVWWFAGLIGWAGLGYVQAERPELTAPALWAYAKLWLIFLVAINVATTRREWRRFAIAWLAIYALYPVRGTLFNIAAGITEQGRYAWNFVFVNPNDLATLTLPVLALAIAMAQTLPKGIFRWGAIGGAIILPAIIFATQSRGGILALGTLLLLVITHHRRRLQAAVVVACTAGAIAVAAPSAVWSRLAGLKYATRVEELAAVDQYGSADQRFEIWRVARAIVADHPVLGVGLHGYNKVHAEYARSSRFRPTARGERDPHSTYLHTAAETGIPGLLLLTGVILSVVIPAWRTMRRPGLSPEDATLIRTLLFGLIAFLQAALFATMEHLPFLYLYLALIYTGTRVAEEDVPAREAPAKAPAPGRRVLLRQPQPGL
jgi:O-antigen ligase